MKRQWCSQDVNPAPIPRTHGVTLGEPESSEEQFLRHAMFKLACVQPNLPGRERSRGSNREKNSSALCSTGPGAVAGPAEPAQVPPVPLSSSLHAVSSVRYFCPHHSLPAHNSPDGSSQEKKIDGSSAARGAGRLTSDEKKRKTCEIEGSHALSRLARQMISRKRLFLRPPPCHWVGPAVGAMGDGR